MMKLGTVLVAFLLVLSFVPADQRVLGQDTATGAKVHDLEKLVRSELKLGDYPIDVIRKVAQLPVTFAFIPDKNRLTLVISSKPDFLGSYMSALMNLTFDNANLLEKVETEFFSTGL